MVNVLVNDIKLVTNDEKNMFIIKILNFVVERFDVERLIEVYDVSLVISEEHTDSVIIVDDIVYL